MLLVANFGNIKGGKKAEKMTETLAYGYSSRSTQRELSNGNQQDRVLIFFFAFFCFGESSLTALEG